MQTLNRQVILDAMIKHETLTIDDIGKRENLGFLPDKVHLQYLLDELTESKHLQILDGVEPCTYTITDKGISEVIQPIDSEAFKTD